MAWKTSIPGLGWSQPIIVGDQVYVTSAVSSQSAPPKNYESGISDPYTQSGAKASIPEVMIDWKVIALDLRSGAVRWERSALRARPRYSIHPSNTYASETPAANAQGIYAFFGASGTAICFAPDGELLWSRDLGVYRQQNNYGTGSSPRLWQDSLYIQCFNEEKAFLVCLGTGDGSEKWRITRPQAGTSWTTPFIWRNERRAELVVSGQKLMTSHDPATGHEFWRAAGIPMPVIASVCADAQQLYFGCRDPLKGGPLYSFHAGGKGEQPLQMGDKTFRIEAWKAMDAAPGMAASVVVNGCIYVVNDAVLYCLDALTGRQNYKKRLPGLRSVIASPVAAGAKIIILDESGNGRVIQSGSDFKILGQSKLEDTFWASPALASNALLLRGGNYLYCIRK